MTMIERELKLPVDCRALMILPHMHFLGKEMEAFAVLPDGKKEWLLRIPNWDFNWQGEYRYLRPVALPAGSTLKMRARYDNSAANVRWMLGYCGLQLISHATTVAIGAPLFGAA